MFEGTNLRTIEQGFDVLTFDEDYLLSRSGAFSMEEKVTTYYTRQGSAKTRLRLLKACLFHVPCPESVADLPATVVS